MLNLVLGLIAVVIIGYILIVVAQLAFAAYLWINRKKVAKNGLEAAETFFEGMEDIAKGLDKAMENAANKEKGEE